MHYLCVDPVPDDVREFRIWVWERHGWLTAKKLAVIANDLKAYRLALDVFDNAVIQ